MKKNYLLLTLKIRTIASLCRAMRISMLVWLLVMGGLADVRADVITGRVVDKDSGEPLEEVQIELGDMKGTTFYIHRFATDSLGRFTTCNADGEYSIIEFNLLGYHSQKKKLMLLGGEKDTLRLGDIRLGLSDIMLRNAEVRARARTFVVRGDTVVFNPKAFRLAEGARLDELIAKLPGVTSKDGTLEWMGKPIRILMEGKELFGNTSLLTQTLPAEAVEHIKAYDKADDMEKRTGKKDGNEDYVLDLKIKPGFLERWYGEAETVYETKDKYKVRGDATYLSTHDPFLVSANVGNNNSFLRDRGFWGYTRGGGLGNGKQQMGAVAYKHAWERKQGGRTLDNFVTVDVNLPHNDSWDDSGSATEVFRPGTDRTFTHNLRHSWNHSFRPKGNFQAELRTDTMTLIKIKAEGVFEKKRYTKSLREGVFTANPYDLFKNPLNALFSHPDSLALLPITTVRTLDDFASETDVFNGKFSASYSRQLKRKASIDLSANYNYYEQRENSFTDRYFDYFTDAQPDVREHQMGRKPEHYHRFDLSANFRQWWGKNVQFAAAYRSNYHYGTSTLNLFDLHLLTGGYDPTRPVPEELLRDVLDKANSYRDEQQNASHEMNVNLEVNLGKWRIKPAVSVIYNHEQSDYDRGRLDTLASRRYWLVHPNLNLTFKPTKTAVFDASYSYNEWEPSLLSTLAYYDDNNPLHTSEGNPNLRRLGTHNASVGLRANLPKHQQVVKLNLSYYKKVDPLSSLIQYNTQTGAYHSKTINIRGGEGWNLSSNYTQYFKEAWEFSNDLGLRFATDYSYLQQTENMPRPLLNRQRSYNLTESAYVTYRTDAFNVTLGGNYSLTRYDNNAYESAVDQTMRYNAYLTGEYRWRSFAFKTDFRLQGFSGYDTPELDRLVPLWNVSAEYKFLRNKAVLKAGFNDLLNRDKNYLGYVDNYSRSESWYSSRHHYFWMSLTYRFDAKKTK